MGPWATDAPVTTTGSWGPTGLKIAKDVWTSYQTTLPSFKSFAFTVPEKCLMKVHTDRWMDVQTDTSKT